MDQDIRQVWFAGVHGDVGGGYPEDESGLSKFPLLWMIEQAKAAGLRIDDTMVNHLGWGWPRPGSSHKYVPPMPDRATACFAHGRVVDSRISAEAEKWKEWPDRKCFLGWYIPDAEPRPIPGAPLTPTPETPIIHRSVIDRMARLPTIGRSTCRPPIRSKRDQSPPIAGPAPVSPPTESTGNNCRINTVLPG